MSVALASDRVMHKGRVELADNNFTEEGSEIFPIHIERSVLGIFVVVVLIPKLLCPFIRVEGPVSLPDQLTPRISQLDYRFSPDAYDLQ